MARFVRRLRFRTLLLLGVGWSAGCGRCGSADAPVDAGAAPEADASEEDAAWDPVEGGRRPPRGEPKADLTFLDGGVAKECTGPDVPLGRAIVDPRCETTSREAKALLAALEKDGGPSLLSQDARLAPDGRVTIRVLNASDRSIALPLSWHPKLPAFSVVAEDEAHGLYELEPPRLQVDTADVPDAGPIDRAHFARIVLPPGGTASTTTTIASGVLRRLDKACRDGGAASAAGSDGGGGCAPTPAKLAPGSYVLHIGQLVSDVQTGLPARITFVVK
jgi:hypothetical protein